MDIPDSPARAEIRDRVQDAIWEALSDQAQRFGVVDREHSLIDMNSGELDMHQVADRVLRVFEPDNHDDIDFAMEQYLGEAGWWP